MYILSKGSLNLLPWLRHIPGDMFGAKKWMRSVEHICDCLREIIEEHQENFEENNIQDFIDAYIAEQRRQKHDVNSTFSGMFVYYIPE